MHTTYFLSTEHKSNLFSEPKIIRPVWGKPPCTLKSYQVSEDLIQKKRKRKRKGLLQGLSRSLTEKDWKKNNGKWNNVGLAIFFCLYLFAPSPWSEGLERANIGESVSRGSRCVLVSSPPPPPPPTPLWKKSLSFQFVKTPANWWERETFIYSYQGSPFRRLRHCC